jgi:hypothetical protein
VDIRRGGRHAPFALSGCPDAGAGSEGLVGRNRAVLGDVLVEFLQSGRLVGDFCREVSQFAFQLPDALLVGLWLSLQALDLSPLPVGTSLHTLDGARYAPGLLAQPLTHAYKRFLCRFHHGTSLPRYFNLTTDEASTCLSLRPTYGENGCDSRVVDYAIIRRLRLTAY